MVLFLSALSSFPQVFLASPDYLYNYCELASLFTLYFVREKQLCLIFVLSY